MSDTVLIIDDDANLLSAMKRQLRGRFAVTTAQSGEEALGLLGAGEAPAVVLCDMRMGGMNGVETLRKVRDLAPDTVRMMLTGNADTQTAIDAINEGNIFRFFSKPCTPQVLEAGLEAAVAQYRLVTAERDLLEKTLSGSIRVLMDMLALTYPRGYARAARLRGWVRKMTRDNNMPHRWQLDIASMLAPLGLVALPEAVLAKLHRREPLSDEERAMVERSPEAARNVINHIPRLQGVAEIVYLQNRGFDGSGFPPEGPSGVDIPFDSRLLRILNDLGDVVGDSVPLAGHFAELEANARWYDGALLRKVRLCLEAPAGKGIKPAFRKLSTDTLIAGMVVSDDVVGEGGRLLLAALTPVSEAHIERLRNLARLRVIADAIPIIVDERGQPKVG
ncbi:HD domain-containing phosphohydrolase [Rhodospirillum rubrum]|uniref:Response regulator receiver domain protein (CheY) n=1 Tax=Rhodospirillum rubrum (strain ATCC 11170 / ATH 1.1.1 / DSM 467 / LMG 4362 / NCIMB 8255 / S1) TaxID=269796 RepID=Q2RWJ9_RHORT|nr:HD domain-containing phosphohydrolase [Rhodospirillum rubrum]ABC21496.1 Response regulator receiver domain protein (CheY) [Rhodospirillum rubrum ATCC 11170]AEO47179.1 response regulator receiver domain-containing protein [Rhodospirillum rubrum F11]MBK5953092.1 response regulator receiver modulated metal-depenent phosphohydrolase [Rhodospirillum rubrum]QXG81170.1 response regulator [Rhodospirillum rubrum]HAQ01410.1 response regulator receiver modulated metal-depenent phosphohydrolase [Rhodos